MGFPNTGRVAEMVWLHEKDTKRALLFDKECVSEKADQEESKKMY